MDLFQDLSPAAFVSLPSLQAGDGVLQPREAVLDVVPSLSLLQSLAVRYFDVWELLDLVPRRYDELAYLGRLLLLQNLQSLPHQSRCQDHGHHRSSLLLKIQNHFSSNFCITESSSTFVSMCPFS